MELRPWQLSLIVLALCASALAMTFRFRAEQFRGHEWLFRRLPTDHAVISGIDVGALRKAGMLDLLAGSRVVEELDYRRFVDQTAFDYRTDLDYIAASFSSGDGGKHFVLQGRFDWDSLFSTAKLAGGRCLNAFCDMPGISSGRNLSFLPLAPDALGLSVTQGRQSAWALASDSTGVPLPRTPQYQAFVALDGGVLSSVESIPLALRPIKETLSSADFVVLGIDARPDGQLELALDADCMSEVSATVLAKRIHALAEHGGGALPFLRGGAIRSEGRSVHGRWPFDRSMLTEIAGH